MKLNSTIIYLFLNWFLIILIVIICQMFPAFYFVGFFFIASRQFAIYLIGHEGVHFLISKNQRINEMVAKYLCLFPVMVSLNMYRDNHLAHHRFIGTALDPDKNLYNQYPLKKSTFIKSLAVHFLSLKMLKDFLRYFTPFYIILKARNTRVFKKKDFIEYIVSQIILIVLLVKLGLVFLYVKFWLAPLFLMIPYYYFVSALQHGLIHQEESPANSRDIVGNRILLELLLPCKTNFHNVHHESPHIRCWDLKKEHVIRKKCSESYKESVDKLFSTAS